MKIPRIPEWKARELYHIIYDFDRFCTANQIEYWVEGGTLIGAIRHGGIIPWDDDADVQMTTASYNRLLKLEDAMFVYNLAIVYETEFGNLMKIIRPNPSNPDSWEFPFIDVFKVKKQGDNLIYTEKIWRDSVRGGRIKISDLYPLKRVKFGNYMVNAPANSKAYLKENYGPDVLSTAYFEGLHTGNYDTEVGEKLKITKFTPAKPFYKSPAHTNKHRKRTAGGIPKIIHQIWIGSQIPPKHALYMATWANYDDWEYKLWDNKTVTKENFPMTWKYIQKAIKEGLRIGSLNTKYAQVGDLMRLEILYRYGGVYVDANIERLKDITPLFSNPKTKFAVSNEKTCGFFCYGGSSMRFISNSFIASTKHNHNLKHLLSPSVLNKINFKNIYVNEETGPYFLGKYLDTDNCSITLIPTNLIYPVGIAVPNKCYKQKPFKTANITFKDSKSKSTYIQYPCNQYPMSYAIKYWDSGGSWM